MVTPALNMTFQKGNTCWNHPNAIATRIKRGQRLGQDTEFKKGQVNPQKGKGGGWRSMSKYAWEIAIKHYEIICAVCGLKEESMLFPHHIDHNHYNNKPENLMIICNSCHGKYHGSFPNEGQFKKGFKPWNTGLSKEEFLSHYPEGSKPGQKAGWKGTKEV